MTTDFILYFVTWNVGDASPTKDFTELLGLNAPKLPNLYAIGLQELKSNTATVVSNAVFDDPWSIALTDCLAARRYVRVKNVQLIGMHLAVFIRQVDLPYVSNVESTFTRTGLYGYWGNKGTVTIRLDLYGVNVCVLNSHFQAHPENFALRIEDYNQTIEGQRFKEKNCETILDHDYIFWIGDLNFRIDELSNEEVRKKILEHDFDTLRNHDQLDLARKKQLIFLDFEEAPVTFPPTFKFDVGTDTYDTSAKQRVPSWCDRVLWRVHEDAYEGARLAVCPLRYTSLPQYKDSDHKPVVAELAIQVLKNAPELPVMFEPLSCWCQTKNCDVTYTVSSSYAVQPRDWIGLYKTGYKHWGDYVTYVWASTKGEDLRDGSHMHSVTFESSYLAKFSAETYHLVYFSSVNDCPVGYSDPLKLLSTEESSESSEEDMASGDLQAGQGIADELSQLEL